MVVVARDSEDLEVARRCEEVRDLGDIEGIHRTGCEGRRLGLGPPGTRKSTYANPEYKKAAPFGDFVLSAIESANPNDVTLKKVLYTGVQFVGILEFQSFGTVVGQSIAGVVVGQTTVDAALTAGNAAANRAAGRLPEVRAQSSNLLRPT